MTFAELFDKFVSNITPGHFEGILLYCAGDLSITIVQVLLAKSWIKGLKGDNGRWEPPEIVVSLWIMLFPRMILASGFLKMTFPTEAWYFMAAVLLFVLLGRERLEKIISSKIPSASTKEVTADITIKETKTEEQVG